MQTAQTYRAQAEICIHQAEHAKTPKHRMILLNMAQTWLRLADEAEGHQRAVSRSGDLDNGGRNADAALRPDPLPEDGMPMHRLLERSAFGPEEIIIIAAAFDDACRQLGLPTSDPRRESVALRVLQCAQTGERDASRLCDAGTGPIG
jgi:hypothetical protein